MTDPELGALPAEPTARRRPWRGRVLGGAIGLAVVVAVFVFVLPRIADYRDVVDVLGEMSGRGLLLLAGATVLNVLTFAPPWMTALPGLSFRQALAVTQTSTAISMVTPGGAAVGIAGSFVLLRKWGFESAAVGLAVTLTSIWNQLASLTFPIVGLGLVVTSRQEQPLLWTVAWVGAVVLIAVLAAVGLALRSPAGARRVGDLAARAATRVRRVARRSAVMWSGESFVSFRARAIDLLRRRWHVLTVSTLVGHLTVFLLLLATLRAVGVTGSEVSVAEAFGAWAVVRLLGAVPFTPAGLGVVELALTTLLVGFGGSNAEVVAGVLVFRTLTIVPTLVLGAAAGATWRLHRPRRT